MKYTKFYFIVAVSSLAFMISSCFGGGEDSTYTANDLDTTSSNQYADFPDTTTKAVGDSASKVQALIKAQEMESKIAYLSDSIDVLFTRINDIEKQVDNNINGSSIFKFMVFGFVLFSLVIWYIFSRFNKKANDILTNDVLKKLVNGINDYNKKQDYRVDAIESKIKALEKASRNITYQNPPHNNSRSPINQGQNEKQSDFGNKEEQPKRLTVFYMPRSLTPMQFEDSKKQLSKGEYAYFKFTVKRNGKAEFVFDPYDESYYGSAYDDRDNSLKPVCDIEIKNPIPQRCKNVSPGEAELRGNLWVVTKKLKLQYV